MRDTRRPLDEVALAQVLRRLHREAQAPWLHQEVARRMAERLPIIRLQPERIVEWAAHLGAGSEALQQAYPRAGRVVVEPDARRRAAGAAAAPRPWWQLRRQPAPMSVVAADALSAGQAQLLWANMVLHGAADPQQLMRQWQGALAVDGFLMFSTLGPGSLQSLRTLYRQQGWPEPHAPFVDMHDLGDMLIEAGFADPVMDQETITLTWPDASSMLAELRGLGGNVAPRRFAGLRTPRWRQRLAAALAAGAGTDGRIALEFEIVYGHAFRPAPRPAVAAETVLPLADMRAMVRAHRGRP